MATAKLIWTSTDGSRWDKEADADKRDALDAKVRAIEETIPRPPKNSDERIAVDPAVMAAAKRAVVELCRIEFPQWLVFTMEPETIHPFSAAGRLLDDCGGPLRRVWFVFMCYRDGYVYEQPYFALNPDQWRGKA